MSQISLSKSVVVYSPNIDRLYLVEETLKEQEIDLKLTSDLQEVMAHLDTFEIERFVLDLDFKGNWENNLRMANGIFTTYFYKYGEKASEKFTAIVYDEMMEEFLNMMGIPNQRNIDFNFEEFLSLINKSYL